MSKQREYVVIGHVAKDLGERGSVLGGSALYTALTAARLGRRAAVVTACEPGLNLQKVLGATPVSFAPSLTSTVFENLYRNGVREQYLHGRAAGLKAEHVPSPWRKNRLVHIAPIAQELTPEIVDIFADCFIGLTLQGWLRGWDRTGRVVFKVWTEADRLLPKADAVVLSEEDVDFRADVIDYFASRARVVAVTQGEKGARVHWAGRWQHFSAFPAREVDPTGAGDVFATAFFHRLEQTGDPFKSTEFANCAASFAVEAVGTSGIPSLDQVERRLEGES